MNRVFAAIVLASGLTASPLPAQTEKAAANRSDLDQSVLDAAMQKRDAARQTVNMDNLKQLALASQILSQYPEAFPSGGRHGHGRQNAAELARRNSAIPWREGAVRCVSLRRALG